MQSTSGNKQRSAGPELGESVTTHIFLCGLCFFLSQRRWILFLKYGETVYSAAGICLTTFL